MLKGLIKFIAANIIVTMLISAANAQTIKGVGFGDSLMAGYQLANGEGFTDQLQKALQDLGYDITIANAGVSGDTTSGGLTRLNWSVPDGTNFVILELGANDALRGISPDISKANLDTMITQLQARNIDVILAGIIAPPNMGANYGDKFNPIYQFLSEKYNVPLYPFFLDGVTTVKANLLSDNMHPNPDGVATMVKRFLPIITAYLDKNHPRK